MRLKLAFIGFGVVGQGLARHLLAKRDRLKEKYGLEFQVVAVSDIRKGSVLNEEGLDLKRLMDSIEQAGRIDARVKGRHGLSSLETIREAHADIVVEVTWTNLQTGEPGLSHVKEAMNQGSHVVTTNKGPVVVAYRELMDLAKRNHVQLRFEGTVMSGTPAISLGQEALAGAEFKLIRGILNGTTNFILDEMEKGKSFEEALKEAQRLGYAEADPSLDIDAWDPAAKILILSNVLMDANLKLANVQRSGIRDVTSEQVAKALSQNKRLKLVASAMLLDGHVEAKVGLEGLSLDDPLAHVRGNYNALTFESDVQPPITIMGPGAGGQSAGFALLTDILAVSRTLAVG